MKVTKQTYGWLVISILLGLLGRLADQRSQSPAMLDRYAQQLERYMQQEFSNAAPLLENDSFWLEVYRNTRRPYSIPEPSELAFLQRWADAPINWMLFQDSVPIFWTANDLIIPDSLVRDFYRRPEQTTLAGPLNTGFAILQGRSITGAPSPLLIVAAVPIKNDFQSKGPYLSDQFIAPLSNLPSSLRVGREGEAAISDASGATLFYLSRGGDTRDRGRQLLGLLLLLAAGFTFFLFINGLANALSRHFHPWLGATAILLAAWLLQMLANWWDFFNHFKDAPLLTPAFDPFIFDQPLGLFFTNSVILLWLMTFFHREFQLKLKPQLSAPWPVVFTVVTYSLSTISLLVLFRLLKSVIMESSLTFDFQSIFGLEPRTLLALTSFMLVTLAVFLFNHRLLQTTSRLGSGMPARLLAAVITVVICSPVLIVIELDINPLVALLIAIVFVIGLDITLDKPSISVAKAVGWLIFFAFYNSVLIFIFRQDRDANTAEHYADVLSQPQDTLLEKSLLALQQQLRVERFPEAVVEQVDSSIVADSLLRAYVQPFFQSDPYLFQHYDFTLFGLSANRDRSLVADRSLGETMRLLERRAEAIPTSYAGMLRWPQPIPQQFTYLLDFSPGDGSETWLLAVRHRLQLDLRVYLDLVEPIPYKGLPQLGNYNYAIYGGPRLLKMSGNIPSALQASVSTAESGRLQTIPEPDRVTLLYRNDAGFTAMLSRQKVGLQEALSLFSFLFSLLALLVIILSSINYSTQALPDTLDFSTIRRASLRNRIQRSVLLLIIGSFVLVGLVTAAYFRRNALAAGNEQLNEKAQAILANLQRSIAEEEQEVTNLQLLAPLIDPIANIHNMDINIYNLQGRLELTSADFLFERRLTAPLINPIALQALRIPTQSAYRSQEQIGRMPYQSAYVPVRDVNGEIIAYLELPYYANDRELNNDLRAFLSALLTVYVFLLLVASATALFVAESITQPISRIGQKLGQLRLGDNEPLDWNSPDEIGQLIAEYNAMIKKLEESTEKLRQSEREGAWREMAKQVAHEIKNPLTPMKLNIQHLLRVQEQDPQRAGAMLSEVAQSIIQQIDGLSRIAGEFSNFAKMPKAENEHFVLNKLVRSVYQLYAQSDTGKTEISMDLPQEELTVFADSTQLMRVINNLIQNALQAIPDSRPGRIDIQLKRRAEEAVISVTDNGSGIPEAVQTKVFFPNFTTKNSGMGLGLAMSKSIVNAAGGQIYFETQEDQGTTFYVTLPVSANNGKS